MKVICAGLQKTGTKTMAEALRILGYNVHDIFQQYFLQRDLWSKILDNTATIEDFKKTLADVDAVTDFPACGLWEQISEAFPDSKVILMERSSEQEWFDSMQNHFKLTSGYLPLHRHKLVACVLDRLAGQLSWDFTNFQDAFLPFTIGCPVMYGTPSEMISKSRYRQHNAYVKATCPPEKLLVYNVKEGWAPLCKFLGVEIPDVPFPMQNVKANVVKQVSNGAFEHDGGYFRKVIAQIIFNLLLLVSVVIGFFTFMFMYVLK